MDIPAWLNEVNQKSFLNARDVASLFGYRSVYMLTYDIKCGRFPHPDQVTNCWNSHRRRLWLVTTVKKEVRRRNANGQSDNN